jgi:hypothetical protein
VSLTAIPAISWWSIFSCFGLFTFIAFIYALQNLPAELVVFMRNPIIAVLLGAVLGGNTKNAAIAIGGGVLSMFCKAHIHGTFLECGSVFCVFKASSRILERQIVDQEIKKRAPVCNHQSSLDFRFLTIVNRHTLHLHHLNHLCFHPM